ALAGKTLIDATNPLKRDMSGLATDGQSGAEIVQSKIPDAKVVKAFNYAFASRQADPKEEGTQLDGFVAGDDATAKADAPPTCRVDRLPSDRRRAARHGAIARGACAPDHLAQRSTRLVVGQRLEDRGADEGL